MEGYTKLFGTIITSSIWSEDDKTRLVWITLLALADKYDNVSGSIPGLADIARVSREDCRKAVDKLLAPDPDSRSQEFEGRRIEEIDGGWHILNRKKYRDIANQIERREYLRIEQAKHRKKVKERQQNVNKASTPVNNPSTHIDIDVYKDVDKDKSLNNNKSLNRDKKIHTPLKDEFIKYIQDNSLLISNPESLWRGYEDGGWIDTQGKPVKNWKLKLRTLHNIAQSKQPAIKPVERNAAGLTAREQYLKEQNEAQI
jgi:hypothetical protein